MLFAENAMQDVNLDVELMVCDQFEEARVKSNKGQRQREEGERGGGKRRQQNQEGNSGPKSKKARVQNEYGGCHRCLAGQGGHLEHIFSLGRQN